MSSLDHNLVCANSLTGIGSVEEALDALVPGRKGNQLTMFDRPIEEALDSAREVLADVAAAAEATRPEAEAAARAALRARSEAETARLLFDAAVLIRIGDDAVAGATEPDKIAALAGAAGAQSVIRKLNPAHFPYLFPEVFLRERPGFDVLLGNPPWEKVKVEEHNFWALRFPGLRAMPASRRREETERLALSAPGSRERARRRDRSGAPSQAGLVQRPVSRNQLGRSRPLQSLRLALLAPGARWGRRGGGAPASGAGRDRKRSLERGGAVRRHLL